MAFALRWHTIRMIMKRKNITVNGRYGNGSLFT